MGQSADIVSNMGVDIVGSDVKIKMGDDFAAGWLIRRIERNSLQICSFVPVTR